MFQPWEQSQHNRLLKTHLKNKLDEYKEEVTQKLDEGVYKFIRIHIAFYDIWTHDLKEIRKYFKKARYLAEEMIPERFSNYVIVEYFEDSDRVESEDYNDYRERLLKQGI